MMAQLTTPKELGYRFPAEWEPQEAVWFAWPVREDLWPDCLERVRKQLTELYKLAARFQKVRVLCPKTSQDELIQLIGSSVDSSNIELFDYQADDVWIRDFGPLFLINDQSQSLCIADWRYNAWGNKFPQQERDDRASAWIAGKLGLQRFRFETVLEGGAIESNGAGQILTTEAVLLNPNRNGEMSKSLIERRIAGGLGVDSVLWLKEGLVGDDTDGHIDNLARFFMPEGILIAESENPENPNFDRLQENTERLRAFVTPNGARYASVRLPIPSLQDDEGAYLAASYLNYIVLNGAVIVPTYHNPERDMDALMIIGDCFPDREVIGFDCTGIIKEGGALHCMSQHQPAVG
jgi:agmatine deiminase